MKKFKVMLSIFMVLIIISISITPILAEDIKIIENETVENDAVFTEDEYVISDETDKSPYNNDQKIICKATIEEDFDESSVLVVLKNEVSLDFDNYSCPDFSEVNPKRVQEITEVRSDRIFDEFSSKKIEYANELISIALANNNLSRSSVSTSINETLNAVDNKVIEENAEVIAKTEVGMEYSNFHKLIEIELNTSDKQSVLDAIAEIEKKDSVLAAHPNYVTKACKIPNDTFYYNQWGIENASLPASWDTTTGSSGVLVGVIDDGIDDSHPDLANNINRTLSKSFVNGISAFNSINGHGTNVAGVIGAVGGNAQGISGVCWNISLVSLQTAYSDGKTYAKEAADAINYAEINNIPILNYSYSFDTEAPFFEAAVKGYDGLLVVAAGNEDADIDTATSDVERYPSLYTSSKIISVSAIGSDNYLTEFTNYGVVSVDIAAPGEGIYTTVNGGAYDSVDGTSVAAPFVTGTAALIKGLYPNITNYGLRKAILDSADVMDSLVGTNKTYGKLNASAALNEVGSCKFTIQYRPNGGMGTMPNTTVTYGFFTNLRNLAYSRAGYRFVGWDAYRVSDNKYRYKSNTGLDVWCVEGTQPQGYEKQLYSNQASVAHTTLVSGDTVVMTAQWTPIIYDISYDANGGIGSMAVTTGYSNEDVQLGVNTFTREHYKFLGWYIVDSDGYWSIDGGTDWSDSNPTNEEKTLYEDGAYLNYTADYEGVSVSAIAQWLMLGDVDLDGEISIMDATLLQSYLSGQATLTEGQLERCDFDGDGEISVLDATALQIYLSGTN